MFLDGEAEAPYRDFEDGVAVEAVVQPDVGMLGEEGRADGHRTAYGVDTRVGGLFVDDHHAGVDAEVAEGFHQPVAHHRRAPFGVAVIY